MSIELPLPVPGRTAAEEFVARHLGHVVSGPVAGSGAFRGGQVAADAALAAYDVTGYARRRNEVEPPSRRGASRLSPYIRHGLLPLRQVWHHVEGGPERDVRKFRDELLWQEYARHWYARLGRATRRGVRRELAPPTAEAIGWDRSMVCVDHTLTELERDGWLVNQTRMWLASEWSVRRGQPWRDGDDEFFRHLLDGSRAANRMGWQWSTGVGSSKVYGFSRWQVEKRAPSLCRSCPLADACPIQDWPDDPPFVPSATSTAVAAQLAGPNETVSTGEPEVVWLTAESLGRSDPALEAHPDLPTVFVFDEPLLARLRLSAKRLVFLTETLAEIGAERPLSLFLGEPTAALDGRRVVVTHAPVPGFADRAQRIEPVETHPWPWLAQPTSGSVRSFTAWRKSIVVSA